MQALGLCGNNDGDRSNEYTTKTGMEVTTIQPFASSWAIGVCNFEAYVGDFTPCSILSSTTDIAGGSCDLLRGPAFENCSRLVDFE